MSTAMDVRGALALNGTIIADWPLSQNYLAAFQNNMVTGGT